jgi:hypothetical protein
LLLSGLIRTYNEEKNLARSLDNLFNLCDEVVISDGGSTDGTHEIVHDYQARGHDIIWLEYLGGSINDDVFFNHAGKQFNFGLYHCRGDWVLACDTDTIHCARLRAQLRAILVTTPHDAFAMYGVHLLGDWNHYAGDLGVGVGLVQVFRNKRGVHFPNRAEHVGHPEGFQWSSQSILMGGQFHWGYMDRAVELAKAQLRHAAMPKNSVYASRAENIPEHIPVAIPWDRCGPNCTSCWMMEASLG